MNMSGPRYRQARRRRPPGRAHGQLRYRRRDVAAPDGRRGADTALADDRARRRGGREHRGGRDHPGRRSRLDNVGSRSRVSPSPITPHEPELEPAPARAYAYAYAVPEPDARARTGASDADADAGPKPTPQTVRVQHPPRHPPKPPIATPNADADAADTNANANRRFWLGQGGHSVLDVVVRLPRGPQSLGFQAHPRQARPLPDEGSRADPRSSSPATLTLRMARSVARRAARRHQHRRDDAGVGVLRLRSDGDREERVRRARSSTASA